MKLILKYIFLLLLFAPAISVYGQISSREIIEVEDLYKYLRQEVKDKINSDGNRNIEDIAEYYRSFFARHYFFDYRDVDNRMVHYRDLYENHRFHEDNALDHIGKYNDSTQWVLPFDYLNGEPVNAYALRHLARQHKMVDIVLHYFNDGKDPKYIEYFVRQMQSLNVALSQGKYEKIEDGNGVYEAFRSGYRILNWLWIHNLILGEEAYSDEDQLYTIATLLQHGQHLYDRNGKYKSGNHQTRGMAALAMLSILFRDFEGTELWYERAMQRMGEHLEKEINPDGFQFERSIHYHMSDINTYYYVYQLAKLSDISVDGAWEDKLKTLFTALIKVAYPDKSAPVLQDDTEIPWAEKNDISGALTLGYLLFEDPEMGYFSSPRVDDRMYWYLNSSQVRLLEDPERRQPQYGSLSFPDTKYFIMREGWDENDLMLIISAGVDDEKPDHQHGDVLGIQAIANGHAILPNYQVRYSLKDFDFFKNSMVKNVALVDDELIGKEWTSNKGGSGFGKFKNLPEPEVLAWATGDEIDFFAGSHDGFENIGVKYSRQVLFLKGEFWIVKDNFESESPHDYKQVWQGHFTSENGPNLIRATFPFASGCDIFQLNEADHIQSDGRRGKEWSIVKKENTTDFNFITVIYPYQGYENRIDETAEVNSIGRWKINGSEWKATGENVLSISDENKDVFFHVKELNASGMSIICSEFTDLIVERENGKHLLRNVGLREVSIQVSKKDVSATQSKTLKPGDLWTF